MKGWIWGLLLFFIGISGVFIIYGNVSTLKTAIPFIAYIGDACAIITFIAFIILVNAARSWHK